MEPGIREIVLNFNGKYSSGYEYFPVKKNALPAILLCHGNYREGKDSKIMLSMAERLSGNGFTVVTFDNVCYNKAWKPDNGEIHSHEEIDMRWAAFAAVTYIREKYDEKRVIIMGHSMGASIALSVGALSSHVNEIIAISPPRISAFLFDDAKLYDFWIENQNNINVKIDMDILRSIRFDMMTENYIPLLRRKRTLFLCGYKERYLNYKNWIETTAASIGENSEMIIVPGADHFYGVSPGKEDPEVFDSLINSIIKWINKNN